LVTTFLFYSHDGYGTGHARRNSVIARKLRSLLPGAAITLVTGLPAFPPWLDVDGMNVVRVPQLLKDGSGTYQPADMPFEQALDARSTTFAELVSRCRPDVVVVDRHPYGTAGELREGLQLANQQGAALVLGLRDVLDAPETIAAELRSHHWEGVEELYDEVLVYGKRYFCDHEEEYGLPLRQRYCGWVVEPVDAGPWDARLLAVAAGGGGDGGAVFRLGLGVLERRYDWRARVAAGPFADHSGLEELVTRSPVGERVGVVRELDGCGPLFGRSAAVIQMAGYNSTFEALAAGNRPILVPRRQPRLEQHIRAERLAVLGLADMVDEGAGAADVDALLDVPRHISRERVVRAGIDLDGATTAARHLAELAHARARQ
jgi:predicted glycosyltransferase